MSDADVTEIAAETMMVAAKVAAPVLLTALLVGFLISLFQAATQIQEQTLSFVPKIIAVAIALLVTGNWVLAELVSFTQSLFDQLPALLDRTGGRDGPLGPGSHAGGTPARDGACHRLRADGPAVQLTDGPGAGQGRVRPGSVGAAVDPDRTDAARADRGVPRGGCGHRGGHRGGARFRRPGAVQRGPDGRRPDRRHRGLLAAAGLRPVVDDAELVRGPPALPAGDHPAVHQRRSPAHRQGLRDLIRRPARGR